MDDLRSRSFLIAAHALNRVIGNKGVIPWHLPDDLARFKMLTQGMALIMGRGTWDSLPGPLPDRQSIIVTSRPLNHSNVHVATNVEGALEIAFQLQRKPAAFIGGERIYTEALNIEWLTTALLTQVHLRPQGDAFFPPLGPEWQQISSKQHSTAGRPTYAFNHFVRPRSHI